MSIRPGPEMADFRPKLRFRAAAIAERRRFSRLGCPGIGGWIVAHRPIRAYLDGTAAVHRGRFNEEADRLHRPFTEADRRPLVVFQP